MRDNNRGGGAPIAINPTDLMRARNETDLTPEEAGSHPAFDQPPTLRKT